jgi:hypothetical protein
LQGLIARFNFHSAFTDAERTTRSLQRAGALEDIEKNHGGLLARRVRSELFLQRVAQLRQGTVMM